jgi:multisubunit Na+/H+ antiporter MnhC subunit
MTALINLIFNIMRLRAAPQDLPHSRFLMLFCIGVYLFMGLVIAMLDQGFGLALLSAGVDTLLLIGLAYLALWIRGYKGRTLQTVTAFAATGTVFEFIGWPLVAYLQSISNGGPSSLSILLLLLIVWNISVIGHILRHAVDVPMWVGSGVALLYIYTSIRVMVALQIAGSAVGG